MTSCYLQTDARTPANASFSETPPPVPYLDPFPPSPILFFRGLTIWGFKRLLFDCFVVNSFYFILRKKNQTLTCKMIYISGHQGNRSLENWEICSGNWESFSGKPDFYSFPRYTTVESPFGHLFLPKTSSVVRAGARRCLRGGRIGLNSQLAMGCRSLYP